MPSAFESPALARSPLFRTALAGAVLALSSGGLAQSPGLRLFSPSLQGNGLDVRMVDGQGNIVHTWPGQATVVHMLDDGSIMRNVLASGPAGRVQRVAFDGTIMWDVLVNDGTRRMHHDIEPMPNGNVLVLARDLLTVPDAIAAGRDPALITGTEWRPDSILEVQPTGPTTGIVVWEWHVKDHLVQDVDSQQLNYGVVGNHPELLDINYPAVLIDDGNYNHANGLDYDTVNDWIVVSFRKQNEIYVIDHSTTTAEAAGHTGGVRGKGGDLLYRWGNPESYRAGTVLDQQLHGQHDPRFIRPGFTGAGNLTIFDNNYWATQSAVVEITLPLDPSGNFVLDPATGRYGPTAPHWTFTEPGFFSQFISGAQRLANGNTLICSGMQRRLFEVTPAGQTVWSYTYPGTERVFQASHVDHALWTDTDQLPVGGGQVQFDHRVDSSLAGHYYLLLGSVSGTTPGTLVPGGVTLPLNADYLTSAMATQFNSALFVNTLGQIGTLGEASSSLVVPAGLIPPMLTGLQMDFAHLIYDPSLLGVQASNTKMVTIVP